MSRIRRSDRIKGKSQEEKILLGVWDYKHWNQLTIEDDLYLQTKSVSKTAFAWIDESIIFGIDSRD